MRGLVALYNTWHVLQPHRTTGINEATNATLSAIHSIQNMSFEALKYAHNVHI